VKKYENMDNFKERLHTLEITLQQGEYKGTLKQKVGGNCFGIDILHNFDIDTFDIDSFCENNCNFQFTGEDDDGNEWFRCVLKNENGEECEIEDEVKGLGWLVVKLEIVDCEIVK
jgi:hypothetical protein